ncbi:hypothetical protein yrohd0001_39150 [Yersinia rohdei ATCC 43380]|nr:hypothetical protein yrohd0001_39150 [Yersinia rohdei ATCC 43380]
MTKSHFQPQLTRGDCTDARSDGPFGAFTFQVTLSVVG